VSARGPASRRCAAPSVEVGQAQDVARKVRIELELRGLLGEPIGVDVIELPVLLALQAEGITVLDGQQVMQQARVIKTEDEITLLNTACMMADAAYDELYRAMRPGMSENECVGLVSKVLYDLGSEHVEGVNAISGERCNPTRTCSPIAFCGRVTRPTSTSCTPTSATAILLLPHVRRRQRFERPGRRLRAAATTSMPRSAHPAGCDHCRSGGDSAEGRGVRLRQREAAFALQYGHGIGLSIWEKPIFSRLVSLEHPK
jgi:Xaa-Pro aminopeptidase